MHRDVKPANILVRDDGLVKLTDFGIARALDASRSHPQHGEMLGTPNYISPEQALGHAATGASDLYALGVVGHEMLSGRRPFDRGTPIATALSHVNEPPPPLPDDVPEDLRDLIARVPREGSREAPGQRRRGRGPARARRPGDCAAWRSAWPRPSTASPAEMLDEVDELHGEVREGLARPVRGPRSTPTELGATQAMPSGARD